MSCDSAPQAHTRGVSFQPTKHQNNYQILHFLKLIKYRSCFWGFVYFFHFLLETRIATISSTALLNQNEEKAPSIINSKFKIKNREFLFWTKEVLKENASTGRFRLGEGEETTPSLLLSLLLLEKRCMTPRVSSIRGFPEEKAKVWVAALSKADASSEIISGSGCRNGSSSPATTAVLELDDMALWICLIWTKFDGGKGKKWRWGLYTGERIRKNNFWKEYSINNILCG